jgi:DNA-binding response OmpR family regulator
LVIGSPYSRRARTALIIASDALAGALLGAAVELAGFRVVFTDRQEAVPDAIRRYKPVAVLVDAALAVAADPASLGPALMTGAGVVYFGTAARLNDLSASATSAGAERLILPEEIERLPAVLAAVVARAGSRQRSE